MNTILSYIFYITFWPQRSKYIGSKFFHYFSDSQTLKLFTTFIYERKFLIFPLTNSCEEIHIFCFALLCDCHLLIDKYVKSEYTYWTKVKLKKSKSRNVFRHPHSVLTIPPSNCIQLSFFDSPIFQKLQILMFWTIYYAYSQTICLNLLSWNS